MTLKPPPRKDLQKRTRMPTLPPATRSRAGLGLTAAAAEWRFALQHCAECGAVGSMQVQLKNRMVGTG